MTTMEQDFRGIVSECGSMGGGGGVNVLEWRRLSGGDLDEADKNLSEE